MEGNKFNNYDLLFHGENGLMVAGWFVILQ